MELIIGTYEEFLVGYALRKKKGQLKLEQSFTNHAHCGSVRSVATCNKYLASGSIDEVIHIISMKHRVETGTLIAHSGTITALEFLRSAYLFSASDDGNICVWNAKRQWKCEKILRGHKEAVNSLSVHSSGKLLLSVSKDKTLRTWNLIKGRCAYILNLKDVAHQVLWSPSCSYFAAIFDYHIDIYDLSTGGILHSIEKSVFEKRINRALFVDDDTIIICGDCNEVMIYNISSKCELTKFTAHENRIKDMAWVQLKNVNSTLLSEETIGDNDRWLVTTSSDGFIKIWSFDFSNLDSEPKLIAEVNSTCRPTCLAVWTPNLNPTEKTDNFSVPELKISKEELEVCKEKIKEKRNKRKLDEADNTEQTNSQLNTNMDTLPDEVPLPKRAKKVKKAKVAKPVVDTVEPSNGPTPTIDDDEDDEEAIKKMKASSQVLKQVAKYKKSNKRNITTFKMRQQQRKAKKASNGFQVNRMQQSEGHKHKPGKPQPRKGNQKGGNNRPFRPSKR